MKKIDTPIIIIIIITLVVFAGIIFAVLKLSPETKKYSPADLEKPRIEVSEENFDFGKMKTDEIKTKKINLKNIGKQPLDLRDFSTSCDCTYLFVIIDGQKSPKFSMANNPEWSRELAPDEGAELEITYEPKIMPVEGEVSRTILFSTNDPDKTNVEINFTANVSK